MTIRDKLRRHLPSKPWPSTDFNIISAAIAIERYKAKFLPWFVGMCVYVKSISAKKANINIFAF